MTRWTELPITGIGMQIWGEKTGHLFLRNVNWRDLLDIYEGTLNEKLAMGQ